MEFQTIQNIIQTITVIEHKLPQSKRRKCRMNEYRRRFGPHSLINELLENYTEESKNFCVIHILTLHLKYGQISKREKRKLT